MGIGLDADVNTHRWRSNPRWWAGRDWPSLAIGAVLLIEALRPWQEAALCF